MKLLKQKLPNLSVLFVLLLMGSFQSSFAQLKFEEKMKLVEEMKEKFEDEDIVGLNKAQVVTFAVDKKSQDPYVVIGTKVKIINLSTNAVYRPYIFYDENYSEVDVGDFEVSENDKKYERLYGIKDEVAPSDGIFHTDRRVKFGSYRLQEVGDIVYSKYKEKYTDVRYFCSFYLNDELPFEQSKVLFKISKDFDVELHLMNGSSADITLTKSSDEYWTKYEYKVKEAPKLKNIDGIPGPSYYHPHIMVQIKSYKKNGKTVKLHGSVDDLYAWYADLVKGVENEQEVLKEVLASINVDAKTDLEKAKNIYNWVQDNIRYIAYEDGIAGFQPATCQDVYSKKYGDCKGMANLTKQLLLLEGIDGRLTWLGTKRLKYDYSIPTLAVDNHMICTAFINGQTYFLDPTSKYLGFNETPIEIQGRQALIENGDEFILEEIPEKSYENNATHANYKLIIDETGKVRGNIELKFIGAEKSSMLYYLHNVESLSYEEMIEKYLTNSDRNFSVSNINYSSIADKGNTFTVTSKIEAKNQVSIFRDEMYLDYDFHKEYSRFDIEEDFEGDYHFDQKMLDDYQMEYELPSGYQVTSLPAPIDVNCESFSAKVKIEKIGNKLNYTKSFKLFTGQLSKQDIPIWNTMVKKLKSTYDDQIILKKVQ
ncbi:MAG: transglutaminase domain-containing protein [Bacteroidetes bacterium]|nr:transglutaminase domain-containing protein [Bacteroidota bacterium]